MTKKFALLAAAVAVALSGISIGATDAEAKKRGGTTYKQWEFDTKHAVKGYEGFSGGHSHAYCSYRREPERKCFYTSGGYEKCKIVSWRLIQKCY